MRTEEPALRVRSSVGDVASRCDGQLAGGLSSSAAIAAATSNPLPGQQHLCSSSSPSGPSSPRAADGLRACVWRLITSPWWTAFLLVSLLALGAIGDLMLNGASNLHLRAACACCG